MEKTHYPMLDETVYRGKLPNGLTVAVVQRKDFSKKLAYFVTDYGSIHTEFDFEGIHTYRINEDAFCDPDAYRLML